EFGDLGGSGRQAVKIVGGAADEGALVRGRDGLESLPIELGQYEGVNWIFSARWNRGTHNFSKRPPFRLNGDAGIPLCAGVDPSANRFDLGSGERLARWHLQIA